MQCYNHSDVGAAGQCQVCSKGLCKECLDLFQIPICMTCAEAEVQKEKVSVEDRVRSIPWEQVKTTILIAWSMSFVAYGIWEGKTQWAEEYWWFDVMWYFAIGGLPLTLKLLLGYTSTPEGEVKKIRDQVTYGDGIIVFFFIMKLIFGFIFSAVAAPFITLYAVWKLFKLQKEKTELKELVKTYPD